MNPDGNINQRKGEMGIGEEMAPSMSPINPTREPEQSPPAGEKELFREGWKTKVREKFPRCPVAHGAVIPDGYAVSHNGVWCIKTKKKADGTTEDELIRVAPRPIFIHRRYHAHATGKEFLGFTWFDDLVGWREGKLPRSAAYGNGLVALADDGAPVTKSSVAGMIRYLEEYEHENSLTLPRVQLVDRLGWHGEEFLWGDKIIDAKGMRKAENFFFDENVGDPSVLGAMHAKGSMLEWVEEMNQIADYPYAWLYIAGAIAAPLLSMTSTNSFLVDIAYQTSSGKSTALFAGASVWGRPEVGHLVSNWYSTNVGIEESCAMNADLPTFFDESKLGETDTRMIRRVIYMVTGAGKKRGKAGGGLRKTKSWKTVFCTCGEQQLYKYGEDDGARARTVGAEVLPFKTVDSKSKIVVDRLTRAYLNNYGHAGPWAIQRISKLPKETWIDLVDEYDRYFQDLVPGANSKALRKARYFGILRVALDILRNMGVNYDPKHLDDIWRTGAGAKDELKSDRAMVELGTWVALNEDRFKGSGGNDRAPAMGWAGFMTNGSSVDIPRSTLKMALGEMWEATLPKIWDASGYLETGQGKLTKSVRLDNKRVSVYRFRWSALFGDTGDVV